MAQDQIARPTPALASRGESVGFAHRTLTNLRGIEQACTDGHDVHVVTQRVLSLLGVVVFPWADGVEQHIQKLRLEVLGKGWPSTKAKSMLHVDLWPAPSDACGNNGRWKRNEMAGQSCASTASVMSALSCVLSQVQFWRV